MESDQYAPLIDPFLKVDCGICANIVRHLCSGDFDMQTCSFHAGEEGVFLVGDGLHWTVAVKHPLQELGIVFFTLFEHDAFSGLDPPCSYYIEHQHSKISFQNEDNLLTPNGKY